MIDLPGRALLPGLRGSAQGRMSTAPLAKWAVGLLCSLKQKAVQSIAGSFLDCSFNSKLEFLSRKKLFLKAF